MVAAIGAVQSGTDFFVYEFEEQLTRLAPQYPSVIAKAVEVLVAAKVPSWDHNDQMKKLLLALGSSGQRETAIRLADRMRHLHGMVEVFNELTLSDANQEGRHSLDIAVF